MGGVCSVVTAIITVLRQLADVIDAMTDEQYCQNPVGAVTGSAGGHVRHSLDHIYSLLAGAERGELDYDRRRRGAGGAPRRSAALDAIERLQARLLDSPPPPEQRLRLRAVVRSDLPPTVMRTSVGRELGFVLSHTVHHNALIAVIAKTLGVPVPDRFGYAPSTIAHLEASACAR